MRSDSLPKLAAGLATGTLFGILLQKSGAARPGAITRQLLLKDHTIAKVMGSAIAVGGVGTELLRRAGLVQLDIKPLRLGGVGIGAAVFGVGMGLLGYCPGTSMAALGGARRTDALVGIAGMLAGAVLFIRLYPQLKPLIEAGDLGKLTLPQVTDSSPWAWLGPLALALCAAAALDLSSAPH